MRGSSKTRSLILRSFVPMSALLLLLPAAAHAAQDCRYSEPRALKLDLAGVKTVAFEVGKHEFAIHAKPGATASVTGKACASDPKWLAGLTVTQSRVGDKLVVKADDAKDGAMFSWSDQRELQLEATIPDNIMVQVRVGSGDAVVEGAARLSGDVGSGDLVARQVRGTFFADVGSGDIVADGVGALHVVSVGSGDLVARNIAGDTHVERIGSGDFKLLNAKGKVRIGSIGSGDAVVSDVAGDLDVERIGSGGLDASEVGGNLTVASVGSGSVSHEHVRGHTRVPQDD